jgi:hypothetical protein
MMKMQTSAGNVTLNLFSLSSVGCNQDCQMVAIQNFNLGIFLALEWIMLVYFMFNWNILRLFGILYSHLLNIFVIWYIFSLFGSLYQEKSGNPGCNNRRNKMTSGPGLEFMNIRFGGKVPQTLS